MMLRLLLLLVAAPSLALAQRRPIITPHAGLVITKSARIRPGVYHLTAPSSLDSAVITIRGDDVTVDFTGVTLLGVDANADPDRAAGVGVRVEGGHTVTIRGAHIRGYKVGLLARGTKQLVLASNDLSYNWKPRLYSLVEHESLVDWNYFQHQEKDEWLRYGAAAYLEDVSGGEIRDNVAEQGMNGLMLTRCDHLRIHDNTFSYNSGLGIALYRSTDNDIVGNRIDYDVRGYSHGFYRRGQDSAGILLYEQSSHNVIAYNSVTHGGDGFFLWAGQSTMDTGEGGANDNLVYNNDFSFAPTNAIEATFSRNSFVQNYIEGSDHGVWGGYSYSSLILLNTFVNNRVGIAIEHGQADSVIANLFDGDTTAIYVWANPIEPSDWGYPKHRDTRSRDYLIRDNAFSRNRVALRVANTAGIAVDHNTFGAVDTLTAAKDTTRVVMSDNAVSATEAGRQIAVSLPPDIERRLRDVSGRRTRPRSSFARLPRSAIVVDEWGPFDYRSPKLWPLDSTHAVPLRLRVLGPAGRWRLLSKRGVAKLSRTRGSIGDTLVVTPTPDSLDDWNVTLAYRGAATVSPRGQHRPAGQSYEFSYGNHTPRIDWDARFFTWSDSTDPRKNAAAFGRLLAGTPLLERHLSRLDFEWYGPQIKALPLERWALNATGSVDLPAGSYTLRTISDDAVRVWVDGKLVIDDWTPHESVVDTATVGGGHHELRVEYYQVDGWTELRLEIVQDHLHTGR